MWDRFHATRTFKDGSLSSYAEFQPEKGSTEDASRQNCTGWYLVTTYYNTDGTVSHTTEQLLYVVCDSDCAPGDPLCTDSGDNSDPGDGGGGNGGENNPPPSAECTELLTNLSYGPSADNLGVEICATGPNTMKKCYRWRIYTISGGLIQKSLVSLEEANLIFDPVPNSWAFQNMTHKSIDESGTGILYSVQVSNVSANPSLKRSGLHTYYDIAQMHLSYTVKISAICDGLPVVFSDPTSSVKAWHVSE